MAQEKILTVKLARLSVTRLTIGPSVSLTSKSRSLWRVITLSTLLYSSESLLWSFCLPVQWLMRSVIRRFTALLQILLRASTNIVTSIFANTVNSKHKWCCTSIVVNTLTSVITNSFSSACKKCYKHCCKYSYQYYYKCFCKHLQRRYKHCCRYLQKQAQILFRALLQMLLTERCFNHHCKYIILA